VLGHGQPAALLAVLRCEHLEAAAQLEARLEHVQVVVVVFDVEHFGHVTDSVLLTAALIASSLDHLVGAGEQRRRHVDAKGFGGLEIDDELELRWLLDWQFRGLLAFENTAGIGADLAVAIQYTGSIANQAARLDEIAQVIDCRHRIVRRQRDDLFMVGC